MDEDIQEIRKLYKEVFDLVYPEIQKQEKGILYKVIHVLLKSEKSQADNLCTEYDIKEGNSIDDDHIHFTQRLENKPNLRNLLKPGLNLFDKARDIIVTNMNPNMTKVAGIVFIACVFVGAIYIKKYLEDSNSQPQIKTNDVPRVPSTSKPDRHITAALCLVVPVSVFNDIKSKNPNNLQDNNLDINELETLIDNALYFLCTEVDNANLKQKYLKFTDDSEDISIDSNREVYIRIDINNGEEMIGKTVPYILKRNLPSAGQRIIEKYGYLEYLSVSGLEKFNRI